MNGAPQTRSPAPLGGGNRAEGNRNETAFIIAAAKPEADFAAVFLARRFGLSLPLARAIAALAAIGGAFT
jgi:hypothetical protein